MKIRTLNLFPQRKFYMYNINLFATVIVMRQDDVF